MTKLEELKAACVATRAAADAYEALAYDAYVVAWAAVDAYEAELYKEQTDD